MSPVIIAELRGEGSKTTSQDDLHKGDALAHWFFFTPFTRDAQGVQARA